MTLPYFLISGCNKRGEGRGDGRLTDFFYDEDILSLPVVLLEDFVFVLRLLV